MNCSDIASRVRRFVRSATLASSRLFPAAGIAALSARALFAGEPPPASPRPQIRYEPAAIVSSWGPPILKAELGRFLVPENRSSNSSRQIELAFIRIPTVSKNPGPPIVWLSGGPGDSGIADLGTPALQLFLELRSLGDVIVLDQRGTGHSVPRLDCPGNFQIRRDVALDRSEAVRAIEEIAGVCAEKWRSAGVDLSSYNTRESAEDVEDLRIALGASKIRLIAGSYGTHLALAVTRAHEESVDRAALLGVVGPDHLRRRAADSDEQLAKIARLAADDPAFAPRVPDLVALIRRVRDRLAARPATVEVETPGGERRSIILSQFDMEWYTHALLTSRESIAHIPALFLAMEDGDFQELAKAADGWRSASAPAATIFTNRCASGASEERELRIAAERTAATLGDATDFAQAGVCRAWKIEPLPAEFRAAVRSAVPVLFVSGSLDGDAPESNAAEVIRGFPNGVSLSVEGAAHSLLGFEDASTRESIVRFLGNGRIRKGRVSLPALAFERRKPGRGESLVARGGGVGFSIQ